MQSFLDSSMPALELSQPVPGPLGTPAGTVGLLHLPTVSSRMDTVIRVSTAAVVLAVAGIAAYISYWHAYTVVRQYGESGVTALLEPGTIDGLVYASSMVILHAARHRLAVPRLARAMLALGIAASLAVNVAQGWSHGLVGAAAAAWPAVALAGSYELLAWMIRTAAPSGPDHGPGTGHGLTGYTLTRPPGRHQRDLSRGGRRTAAVTEHLGAELCRCDSAGLADLPMSGHVVLPARRRNPVASGRHSDV